MGVSVPKFQTSQATSFSPRRRRLVVEWEEGRSFVFGGAGRGKKEEFLIRRGK